MYNLFTVNGVNSIVDVIPLSKPGIEETLPMFPSLERMFSPLVAKQHKTNWSASRSRSPGLILHPTQCLSINVLFSAIIFLKDFRFYAPQNSHNLTTGIDDFCFHCFMLMCNAFVKPKH